MDEILPVATYEHPETGAVKKKHFRDHLKRLPVWYFIRHTLDTDLDDYWHTHIIVLGDDCEARFVAREISDKGVVHFHCVFSFRGGPELLRYRLKSMGGQVYISGKEVQNQVKAIAYCMKDGDWRQSNMNINDMLMAKSITKPKKTAVNFSKSLENLIDRAREDAAYRTKDFINHVIELHIECKKRIYPQHIEGIVRLVEAMRSADYRQRLGERIHDNILY